MQKKIKRLPVTLDADDNRLLSDLRHKIERERGELLSLADIVRLAIRQLAASEGIQCK